MKKLINIIAIVTLLFILTPFQADARINSGVKSHPVEAKDAERAKALTTRLEEIKAMDKSSLTRAEKRALRHEVKAIEKEMKTMSGGVYISIGALLIIIILILLL
ncbi:MAG TPA: hypothetical protein VGK59_23375 [Ohtaekwangia sp.]